MANALKQLMLEEIKTAIKGSQALILVDASKLKSEESLNLRTGLRKLGSKLKVSKSSILARALPAGSEKAMPKGGPVGIVAISSDIAATAKLINGLVKEAKITLHGGVLDGKPLSSQDAARLSDLPTKEEARAQLVRVLHSPLVSLVRIANAKPTELVRLLKVKADEAPVESAPVDAAPAAAPAQA